MEICTTELETKSSELIILSLYKAPTGDFNQFIKDLNDAVKHQYTPTADLLICGDTNTDYLNESNQKKKTTSLIINNINLSHTLNFGTRIQTNSCTATDNTFVDNSKINLSSISPIIDGLSDHDAQILTIKYICSTINKFPLKQRSRLTDSYTIMNFQDSTKKRILGICLYR